MFPVGQPDWRYRTERGVLTELGKGVTLVDWQDLSESQRAELAALRISDRDVDYAGTIAKLVDDCRSTPPDRLRGFAVLAADAIVGFVILKRPPASPEWAGADAVTLHGLRIDTRHRGRGLGRAALAAAIDTARRLWPGARRLALSVDADNVAAKALYVAFGMRGSGPVFQGRIGLEHRLELDLPAHQT